jgi:putative flippase GtrA
MKKIINLYKKYEEIINYLIVGGMTTLVSIVIYALFTKCFHVNYMIANVISWVISVLFAYVTNRIFVFKSKSENIILEIYQFFKYRVFSFLIEILLMYIFVELINIDDMISKVIVQVIVIVLNYVFSKLFVFKKES